MLSHGRGRGQASRAPDFQCLFVVGDCPGCGRLSNALETEASGSVFTANSIDAPPTSLPERSCGENVFDTGPCVELESTLGKNGFFQQHGDRLLRQRK